MRTTTPPLNALRAFEAAARAGSFAQASLELGVTPSAVSQQVARLEEQLGLLLFTRARQRIQLTDAGRRYRASVGVALDRIESATVDLLRHGGGAPVTIGALPSLAAHWLTPRLGLLLREQPDVRLEVTSLSLDFASADRAPDLRGGLIDLGLFYGDGEWSQLASERLMDERLIPVAAPQVLERHADRWEREASLCSTRRGPTAGRPGTCHGSAPCDVSTARASSTFTC